MADLEAAVTSDGVLLGVRMNAKLNAGAYQRDPFPGPTRISMLSNLFQGPTRIEGISAHHTSVFSNKATYVSYRAPWASADFLRERLLDIVAREVGIDPLEVRRRNYVETDQPPLALLDGRPFTGVTARESVEQAARVVDWEGLRRRQSELRASGRYLGVGMASYIEAAPGPKAPGQNDRGAQVMGVETTHMSVDDDGTVVIVTRQQPTGQGHETTLAQVASDELGVRFEDVRVVYGDSDITPQALVGTGGSRAATMANGAVLHASRQLRQKILAVAADLLEANAADVELTGGIITVRGTPQIALSLGDLARRRAENPARFAGRDDVALEVTYTYDGGESGWSSGTHCCVLEVDVETGTVRIDRYVVVEDCGVTINPGIVEGQIRGAVAQAIGAVLLEHSAYGEDGQFLAGSFMDYLMPTSTDIPNIEIHHVETKPTDPDVNFRGVGEGGMLATPACLANAIEDALAPLGVRVREQHLPPSRLLDLAGTTAPR
jgi:carbon-monoxide dehydrogenase large subunit